MKINAVGHLVKVGKTNPNKAKQTQIQNRQNEHNFFYNNELRTNNYER